MPERYSLRRSNRVQKVKKQPLKGSPKDQIARIPILLEELDLDVSHAHKVWAPEIRPVLSQKKRSWKKWTKEEPLTDPAKLPRGWHMNEDDLAIDDIDGQIKRCHERIAENIMPDIFRQRLKEYTLAKDENEQMRLAETEKHPRSTDLSFDVIQRLHTLEAIKTDLEESRKKSKSSDASRQLLNINAILEAYRSKKLDWNDGLVTYWAKGVQICQPRNFDWDEFEIINSKYNHKGAFWTEGLDGPGPEPSYASLTAQPSQYQRKLTGLRLALRLPNTAWFAELDFVHDTGCSMMGIYKNDIATIMGPYSQLETNHPPVIGKARSRSSNGDIRARDIIEVEVTILDRNRRRMTAWSRIPCAISEGSWTPNSVPRLDGPILRDTLYTATAPDLQRFVYFANTAHDIQDVLPNVDLENNPPTIPTSYMSTVKAIKSPRIASPTPSHVAKQPGMMLPKIMPGPASGAPP
ncbi:unnamed protein product [Penicillium olsonii]|nr:unnamed protein product [Penicillium olsonii]CAG7923106.1 unnamed protein product [Penicillium olsonii]